LTEGSIAVSMRGVAGFWGALRGSVLAGIGGGGGPRLRKKGLRRGAGDADCRCGFGVVLNSELRLGMSRCAEELRSGSGMEDGFVVWLMVVTVRIWS